MLKKGIALISAVSMLLSFAACGEKENQETTTAKGKDVVATDVVTNEEGKTTTGINEDKTDKKSDKKSDRKDKTTTKKDDKTTNKDNKEDKTTKKTTKVADDKTTKPTTTKPSTTKKKDTKPSTKKEIIDYYNKAVNKVKSSAKSVVKTYDSSTNYNGIVDAGGKKWLSSTGKWLMDKFLKENNDRVEYKGSSEIIANFPVKGMKTSNVNEAAVKDAKCVDNGDYYEITLTADCSDSNPDKNPTRGGGKVGRMFNILELKDVENAVNGAIDFKDADFSYRGGKLIAHIDKDTGNMTYLYTDLPMVLGLTAVGVNAKVGLEFENKWEINW